MLAAAARSVAVVVIIGWLAYANPERGLAYAWVLGTGSIFLVTGVAQLWFYSRPVIPPLAPYVFVLLDALALAAVLHSRSRGRNENVICMSSTKK